MNPAVQGAACGFKADKKALQFSQKKGIMLGIKNKGVYKMGGKPATARLREIESDVVNDYKSGMSIKTMQEKYACSNNPIRKILLTAGVMRPAIRPHVLAPYREELVSLYRSGWDTKRLGKKFNADRNTVSEFLKRAKVLRKTPIRGRQFFIESDLDKGMLAGLLLGEGSIIIRGQSVRISIWNQDAHIIGWLGRFGGRIYWMKPRPRSKNPCAAWNLSRSIDVFHCLSTLLPLLVGKKKNLAVAALHALKNAYGFQVSRGVPES